MSRPAFRLLPGTSLTDTQSVSQSLIPILDQGWEFESGYLLETYQHGTIRIRLLSFPRHSVPPSNPPNIIIRLLIILVIPHAHTHMVYIHLPPQQFLNRIRQYLRLFRVLDGWWVFKVKLRLSDSWSSWPTSRSGFRSSEFWALLGYKAWFKLTTFLSTRSSSSVRLSQGRIRWEEKTS